MISTQTTPELTIQCVHQSQEYELYACLAHVDDVTLLVQGLWMC